jgi:Component of IIS longevity pathway SMK-1
MACVNKLWRVKVYILGGDGDWIDNGTGLLEIEDVNVCVYSEDDPDVKIMTYTIKDEDYRRQGDTILTWIDEDGSTYAFSFQEKVMTQEALEVICKIQSKSPKDIGYDEDLDDYCDLAIPTKHNLHEILLDLTHGNKNNNAVKVLTSEFVPKLRLLFLDCPADDKGTLEIVFHIYKQLCIIYVVHLNSTDVVDLLVSDLEFETVLAALENDPGLGGVVFKLKEAYGAGRHNNILNVDNNLLLEKIKKANRLQFIKDTALARALDDSASNHFFSMQVSVWKEIVGMFISSDRLRQQLYTKLENSVAYALEFLMELCGVVKQCTPQLRHDLYEVLYQDGIVTLLDSLSHGPNKDKILEFLGEMYTSILDVSPLLIINFFFSPSCTLGSSLLAHITASILNSQNFGTILELGKLIRMLLDPANQTYFDRICEIFYKDIVPILIKSINSEASLESKSEVMVILTFCVENHKEKVKILLTITDVMVEISKAMKSNKHLAIYAIKFFKAVILKNESSINNLLIRFKLLDDILGLFIANANKENLLFSSTLSLLQVAKKSSVTVLKYIIKNFVTLFKEKGLESFLDDIIQVYNKQKHLEAS